MTCDKCCRYAVCIRKVFLYDLEYRYPGLQRLCLTSSLQGPFLCVTNIVLQNDYAYVSYDPLIARALA